jgi:hypothetical protein
MSEYTSNVENERITTHDKKTVTNRHPNRVQQTLADPADSWNLAYGQVPHKVLDSPGRMR